MIVLKDHYHTFAVAFGATRTGKTVQYRIVDYDLAEIVGWTATNVKELDYGMYGVRLLFSALLVGYIQWRNVTDGNLLASEEITVEEDFPTNTEFEVRTLPAADYVVTTDTIAGVTTVGSVTSDVGITQAGADKVWGSSARSLTTFGTLVADIASAVWGAVTRTLTAFAFTPSVTVSDKTGFSLTSAYDPAKTAAQASVCTETRLAELDPSGLPADIAGIPEAPSAADIKTALEADGSKLATIYKIETGRWRIVGTQMIFYDADGTTPILTFDLKDIAGLPTDQNVYERVPT